MLLQVFRVLCVFAFLEQDGTPPEVIPAAAVLRAMISLSFSSPMVEWVAERIVNRSMFVVPANAVANALEEIGVVPSFVGPIVNYLQWVRECD